LIRREENENQKLASLLLIVGLFDVHSWWWSVQFEL